MWSSGVAAADFNRSGKESIFVANYNQQSGPPQSNQLLQYNPATQTMTNVAHRVTGWMASTPKTGA